MKLPASDGRMKWARDSLSNEGEQNGMYDMGHIGNVHLSFTF